MPTLHELPSELLTIICETSPGIIPDFRLTSRKLHDASFHTFLHHYFSEISVFPAPASIQVLLDIASDTRFGTAIRQINVEMDLGTSISLPTSNHSELVRHGTIRDILSEALNRLPNCTILKTGGPRHSYIGWKKFRAGHQKMTAGLISHLANLEKSEVG